VQKFEVPHGNQGIEAIAFLPCDTYVKKEHALRTIGHARVSTRDQDLTGQIDALLAAGAGAIYREKISGARADRPELTKLMKVLAPGDVVLVTKLDRLGRSTRELLELNRAHRPGRRLLQVP
jgi:predicted site-specific integrase-resolvase